MQLKLREPVSETDLRIIANEYRDLGLSHKRKGYGKKSSE